GSTRRSGGISIIRTGGGTGSRTSLSSSLVPAPSRINPKPTGERMTRFLVGLLLAASTLGGNDLAAQRPAQRPPAPSIERAGPEGPPAGVAQLTRSDVQAWLDGFLPYA